RGRDSAGLSQPSAPSGGYNAGRPTKCEGTLPPEGSVSTCGDSLLLVGAAARGVVVQAVERGGGGGAEVELAVRRLLRVVDQLALEVLPPPLVAGLLDLALQLPLASFVLVHGWWTPADGSRFASPSW